MSTSNPRLLFASYHAYLDHSSGAALATRDLFEDLSAHGWACQVVCGPQFDFEDGRDLPSVLRDHAIPYHLERCGPSKHVEYELYHLIRNGVPVTLYRPGGFEPGRSPDRDQGLAFLDVVARAVEQFRPDVVLTYGGGPVGPYLIRRAKRRGARVVFALHNLAYPDTAAFRDADALWVPSEYARQEYASRLGVTAEAVPWPWDHSRAVAGVGPGRHVTFVNPQPSKGVAWVARIALELSRRRPDIPVLIVEGRGGIDWLRRVPLDLGAVKNLRRMTSTLRPADFYAESRAILMPSLAEETFGRVAAEALANGLPVLASRRGALPETLGGAGFVFDIPERFVTQPLDPPAAQDVADWVQIIERLWSDDHFYSAHRQAALERARVWDADRLQPGIEAFFRRVAGM